MLKAAGIAVPICSAHRLMREQGKLWSAECSRGYPMGVAVFVHHAAKAEWDGPQPRHGLWGHLVAAPARFAMQSYLASRLAATWAPDAQAPVVSTQAAVNALAHFKEVHDQAQAQYVLDGRPDAYLDKLSLPMVGTAVALASHLGFAAASGKPIEDDAFHQQLAQLELTRWWSLFANDLARLFITRHRWDSVTVPSMLESHIERIYASMGLLLDADSERVRFWLPG
jgi:hypothetical protein